MTKKKEKMLMCISIDPKLAGYIEEMFSNRSKYIEWLIEQDLLKKGKENVRKIIL